MKKCFIISPIGNESSEERRKLTELTAIIKPLLEKIGFALVLPHTLATPGAITKQIINNILQDELVIANLTGLNANVMYEVAIRHASGKPIVYIAEKETVLPFDIATERTLFYNHDVAGMLLLRDQLGQFINEALSSDGLCNPIYDAKRNFELIEISKHIKKMFPEEALSLLSSLTHELKIALHYTSAYKQTYRKTRKDGTTTFIICTEQEAETYHLKEREYLLINSHNLHLDGNYEIEDLRNE